jgi:hypothetical protein
MAPPDDEPVVPHTGMHPATPRPRWAGPRWRFLSGGLCGAACGVWLALSAPGRLGAAERLGWALLGALAGLAIGAVGGLLGWWLGRKLERSRASPLLGYHWSGDLLLGLGTLGAALGAAAGALRPQLGALQGWLTGGTMGALAGAVVAVFEYFAGKYGFAALLGALLGAVLGASLGLIGWAGLAAVTAGRVDVSVWPLALVLGAFVGAPIGGYVGGFLTRR